jgi:hypothetical protein
VSRWLRRSHSVDCSRAPLTLAPSPLRGARTARPRLDRATAAGSRQVQPVNERKRSCRIEFPEGTPNDHRTVQERRRAALFNRSGIFCGSSDRQENRAGAGSPASVQLRPATLRETDTRQREAPVGAARLNARFASKGTDLLRDRESGRSATTSQSAEWPLSLFLLIKQTLPGMGRSDSDHDRERFSCGDGARRQGTKAPPSAARH